jgi:subtilisin family serine protease
MADKGLVNFIVDTMTRTGLSAESLELEITERGNLFETSPALPGGNAFQNDLPFGAPGLTLGAPSAPSDYLAQGGVTQTLDLIQARRAWRTNQGEGATIVVIDSGIDGGRIPTEFQAGGWTDASQDNPWVDSYGHGTMVAIIAREVAPRAKIFSLKAKVGESGGLLGSSVIKGLDLLLGLQLGPIASNHSWGVYGCVASDAVCRVIPTRLVDEINKGAVTVWAAGNSRGMCPQDERLLWCLNSSRNSISVAAVGRDLQIQPYSTPGPGQCSFLHPTVACPTFGILPWGSGFRDFGEQGGGTSAATPQVVAAMAILLTAFPDATVQELKWALQVTANQRVLGQKSGWNKDTGFGLLQIDDALFALQNR